MLITTIIISSFLFLSASRLIEIIENDDDYLELMSNMDHSSYIYFTKNDCENCELAFEPYK